MKKVCVILVVITFIITAVNLVFSFGDTFFYGIEDLPEGEFLYSSLSPSGEKTLKVYRVESNLGNGVRGELITLKDNGEMEESNIFWCTGIDNAVTGWINDSVVKINNTEIDTAKNEIFDSRHMTENE